MALDYMAIISLGVYPTPGGTAIRRAALGVSLGLANFDLPAAVIVTIKNVIKIIGSGFKKFIG